MQVIRIASLGLSLGLAFAALNMYGCQKLNSSHSARSQSGIVNGQTMLGSEPFSHAVIGLGIKTNDGFDIFCSGSLISPNTIVTAAHCIKAIKPRQATYIVFGLSESGADVQGRKIINAAFNETYQADAPDEAKDLNDLGIARFAGDLPAGYAPAEILDDPTVLKTGSQVYIAGYGYTDGKNQLNAGTLRYTEVTIQDGAYGANEIKTDESHNGSCNGDSGGPALVEINNKFFLWGATSRGDDDCLEYGIYTKITSYRDWINQEIQAFDAAPAVSSHR